MGRVLPAQHWEGDAYRGAVVLGASPPRLAQRPSYRASHSRRDAMAPHLGDGGDSGDTQPWRRPRTTDPDCSPLASWKGPSLAAESPAHAASSANTAIHTSVKVDGDGVGCASVWTGVKTAAGQKFLEAAMGTTNFGSGPGQHRLQWCCVVGTEPARTRSYALVAFDWRARPGRSHAAAFTGENCNGCPPTAESRHILKVEHKPARRQFSPRLHLHPTPPPLPLSHPPLSHNTRSSRIAPVSHKQPRWYVVWTLAASPAPPDPAAVAAPPDDAVRTHARAARARPALPPRRYRAPAIPPANTTTTTTTTPVLCAPGHLLTCPRPPVGRRREQRPRGP